MTSCSAPFSGPVRFAPCALGLQRREEAIQRGIVPDVARTAHRTDDAVIGHQLLELLAGVLAATVGMMQQRIGFTPSPDRHHLHDPPPAPSKHLIPSR